MTEVSQRRHWQDHLSVKITMSSRNRLLRIHERYHGVACRVCELVWYRMERDNDLIADLMKGTAQIEANRWIRWSEARRSAYRRHRDPRSSPLDPGLMSGEYRPPRFERPSGPRPSSAPPPDNHHSGFSFLGGFVEPSHDECTADARCDCMVIKPPHILRSHWVPEP